MMLQEQRGPPISFTQTGKTLTTIDYLLTQSLPASKARDALRKLISLFEIALVNRPVIERALGSKIHDFEDAKVFNPNEFLALFNG